MNPTLINNEFGLMDQRPKTLKNLKRGEIIIIIVVLARVQT